MPDEVIILAGGLGTRLQGVIKDIPKPMAPIGEEPFLAYLFKYLKRFPIEHVVLAVGYKYESIESYFGNEFHGIKISYAIEEEPLGTGGAIKNAFQKINGIDAFLLNGDTFFDVDLNELKKQHQQNKAHLTLSLKPMKNFKRYGTVETSEGWITKFNEKMPVTEGLINGGVYLVNREVFQKPDLPQKFSFETDIMEKGIAQWNMQALVSKSYFIDIGIPEDYQKAQKELPQLF